MSLNEVQYCSFRDLRITIASWNVDAIRPSDIDDNVDEIDLFMEWFRMQEDVDIIAVGFQELVDLESGKVAANKKHEQVVSDATFRLWQDALSLHMNRCMGPGSYQLIDCRQLVGLFLCVFAKKSEIPALRHVASTIVKTGLGGLHGNKGAIATRLVIDDSSICFLNCHLAAHQKEVLARNSDCQSILKDGLFPEVEHSPYMFRYNSKGAKILDHENVFWFGDMNYRIDLERPVVMKAVQNEEWEYLMNYDQLIRQKRENPYFALREFQENPLMFAPTFKYDVGTNNYDTSEKQRIPAWCDRILWNGNVRPGLLKRLECSLSDHRPICGTFNLRVKKVDEELEGKVFSVVAQKWKEMSDSDIELLKHQIFNK